MEQIKLVDFIKKVEQDQTRFDFRVTTMDFEKSDEWDKFLEFKGSGDTDPDKCSLIWEVYQKLWDIDDKNREAYTGDTMNSVMRTLNKHLEINEKKVSKKGEEFLSVAYTIGNFIPVPSKTENRQSFNTKRNSCYAQDYWDRTLYCIYNWYHWEKENDHEKAEKWLRILLLATDKIKDHTADDDTADDDTIVNACIEWLKAFCDKEGKPSWDIFVEKNYLQDYTEWPTRPYSRPKEFWAGHFCGGTENALPQTPEQFEAFFTHATACIKARSARMVAALREMDAAKKKLQTLSQKQSAE